MEQPLQSRGSIPYLSAMLAECHALPTGFAHFYLSITLNLVSRIFHTCLIGRCWTDCAFTSCSEIRVAEDGEGKQVDLYTTVHVQFCHLIATKSCSISTCTTRSFVTRGSVFVSPNHRRLSGLLTLPWVGTNFQLDASLYNLHYFGRGPDKNYPDRKAGSFLGHYQMTPTAMSYLKYIVPGENGSSSDCEWISLG